MFVLIRDVLRILLRPNAQEAARDAQQRADCAQTAGTAQSGKATGMTGRPTSHTRPGRATRSHAATDRRPSAHRVTPENRSPAPAAEKPTNPFPEPGTLEPFMAEKPAASPRNAMPADRQAAHSGRQQPPLTGRPQLKAHRRPSPAKLEAARAAVGPVEGHELSDEQLAAIAGAGPNTLVLAGAGTGKTTTITGYAAWLLATGRATPEEILVLSFTRASAAEMAERIRRQTGKTVHAGTFHSLGLEICRRANAIGSPQPQVADSAALEQAVRQEFAARIMNPANARYRRTVLALMPEPVAEKYRAWASPHRSQTGAASAVTTDTANTPPASLEPLADPAFAQCTDHLLATARTVIGHMRADGLTVADLRRRNRAHADETDAASTARNGTHARIARFLDFVAPLHAAYVRYLAANHAVDFAGMITEATRLVRENRYASPFRYLLIDEYQDMSRPRYELIRALREQAGQRGCTLFAVGDDWQSIYRFAGSDVSLILDFDRLWRDWGPTRLFRITVTRRFREALIEASSRFVMADPSLYAKRLRSADSGSAHSGSATNDCAHPAHSHRTAHPIGILCGKGPIGTDEETESQARFAAVTDQLARLPRNTSVLLLGRYADDLDRLLSADRNRMFTPVAADRPGVLEFHDRPDLRIEFMTVHKSKGLQRDVVFLLATSGGAHGFPSALPDEPVLGLLLPAVEPFPYAEERRLFYVAMTRCVKRLFLVVDRRRPSRFIYELRDEVCPAVPELNSLFRGVKLPPRCPDCGEALVLRGAGAGSAHGNRGAEPREFYSCTNWPVCRYTCSAA